MSEDWFDERVMRTVLREFGGSDYYRAVPAEPVLRDAQLTDGSARIQHPHAGQSQGVLPLSLPFADSRHRTVRDADAEDAVHQRRPVRLPGRRDVAKRRRQARRHVQRSGSPGRPWSRSSAPRCVERVERARRTLLSARGVSSRSFGATSSRSRRTRRWRSKSRSIRSCLAGRSRNLLAAHNPETRERVRGDRKRTGSFYTPRNIVDYLVDQALILAIGAKAKPEDGDPKFWRERLRYLLDYEDAGELFEEADTRAIIGAIAELRVLDPAVGSGAFAMAALQKLTLALRRLDPDNAVWQQLQKERAVGRADSAFDEQDRPARDAELLEISEAFSRYSGDFGRKLYLIQNSIYGVDIQPIACQIARLRFFISLAIEQEHDDAADNIGITPLPNLDTRIVAAFHLAGLDGRPTGLFRGTECTTSRSASPPAGSDTSTRGPGPKSWTVSEQIRFFGRNLRWRCGKPAFPKAWR